MVTPLQLTLSKHVYEQILETVDHITPPDADDLDPGRDSTATTIPDISESSMEPSMSALKLDDIPSMSSGASRDQSLSADQTVGSTDNKPMIVKGQFDMPVFCVRMTGDLGKGEQGFVNLKFQDFHAAFEKGDTYTKNIEVSLQSLLIEDLLQSENSKHRNLMVSSERKTEAGLPLFNYMSTPCPSSMIDAPLPDMPRPLPCSFTQEKGFAANARKSSSAVTTGYASKPKSTHNSECR